MKTVFLLLFAAGIVQAQAPNHPPSNPWTAEQRAQYRAKRNAEIRRHNANQEEAIRMVTQGIRALQRPSDPWNAYGNNLRGIRPQPQFGGGYRYGRNGYPRLSY